MKVFEYIIEFIIIGLLVLNFSLEINKEDEITKNKIKVEVKGKVSSPGVYELDSDSRVIDLINASGGLLEGISIDNINLSSKLEDEMVVMIENDNKSIFYIENTCTCPVIKSSGCNTYKDSIVTKKVSINTGTLKELMTLTGIGEGKAKEIIKYREENGNFNSIEDITNVKGIGKSIYDKIKDNITI